MNRHEHLMTIAQEECAEVAQRLSKALRFGMEQIQAQAGHAVTGDPEESLTNRERIRKEYSDLAAVLEMLGIGAPLGKWMDEKRAKVERFLAYSAEVGTLGAEGAADPPAPPQGEEPDVQLLAWAVVNCHMLARRALARSMSDYDREKWGHVQRICEKAGARSSGVLRASVPTEGSLSRFPSPGGGEMREGWMRFWGVFACPWPVVTGFACAHAVSSLLYQVLKSIVTNLW